MNEERIQAVAEPIEADNIAERRELLDEKIDLISLIYADKKYQEIKREEPDYKFHEALMDYTVIKWHIKRRLYGLEVFSFKQHGEKIDSFFFSFFKQLDSLYEKEGFNLDKILELIAVAKDSIRQYLGVENYKKIKDPNEEAEKKQENSLVYFEDIDAIAGGGEGRWSGLKKLGFSKNSKLTEVHVRDFYRTDQDRLGLELIKADLGKVAVHIIDESPETAVVVGASWLISTAMSKALGFRRIPEGDESDEGGKKSRKRKKENDPSTWTQFIDKDGQINKKRFDKFCATGEIPFKSVKAYIPVEDFLRRYLPAERHGEVILKELRADHEDVLAEMELISNTFKQDWDTLLKGYMKSVDSGDGSLDLPRSFIDNSNTQKLLNLVTPADRETFIIFLRDMYSKKIPWKEFKENETDEMKRIIGDLEERGSGRKYIERKVVID